MNLSVSRSKDLTGPLSVKIYYSSTNSFVEIGTSISGIFAMALVIMFFLWVIPDIRKAVVRMFGLEEEEPEGEKPT
jgi:hypothetical protein